MYVNRDGKVVAAQQEMEKVSSTSSSDRTAREILAWPLSASSDGEGREKEEEEGRWPGRRAKSDSEQAAFTSVRTRASSSALPAATYLLSNRYQKKLTLFHLLLASML